MNVFIFDILMYVLIVKFVVVLKLVIVVFVMWGSGKIMVIWWGFVWCCMNINYNL